MEPITYSLLNNKNNSDDFYKDISIFTNEVLTEIYNSSIVIIDNFIKYFSKKSNFTLSEKEEYAFNFLMLGVFLRLYSGRSDTLSKIPRKLLIELTNLRDEGGNIKIGVDSIRGILGTIFLLQENTDTSIPDFTTTQIEKLLYWLSATGEFKNEVKSLTEWHEYLLTLKHNEIIEIIEIAYTLAAWFEIRSEMEIGKYTNNVENYLTKVDHSWHEDVIFCGRYRVEYHLNMIASEIMNRAFRDKFTKTNKKIVILPACMCLLPPGKCMAYSSEKGFICKGCCSNCNVNIITQTGNENNFSVLVVSHGSSISSSNGLIFLNKKIGIVGVACVLNLVSGGLMLKNKGIPAQCVLLDYCGCKNHWSKDGIPTKINIPQLIKIINFANQK